MKEMAKVEFFEPMGEFKEDPRGFSFFPWRAGLREPQDFLKTFHLISLQPGQVRGNHLHPGHWEWLYPFHGNGIFSWEPAPGEVEQREFADNRTLICIPPGVAHALRNPGPKVLYLLSWRETAGPAPGEPETVPRPIVPES